MSHKGKDVKGFPHVVTQYVGVKYEKFMVELIYKFFIFAYQTMKYVDKTQDMCIG